MARSYQSQKRWMVFIFLLAPIALIFVFIFFPALNLFYLSATSWNGYSLNKDFIGLRNYQKVIFEMPMTWVSLGNNFTYFIVHTLMLPVEMGIASILCSKIKAAGIFKSMIFMPYIINLVAIAFLFSQFFSPNNGAYITLMNTSFGNILKNTGYVDHGMSTLKMACVSLWKWSGQHIIIFTAGIMSIPSELYEAAKMDGASDWDTFLYITVPGLKNVLELLIFLNIRGCLMMFEIPFLMTNGGPGYDTSTFMVSTIKTAFQYNDFGLASALAVVLMLIIIVGVFIQNRFFQVRGF